MNAPARVGRLARAYCCMEYFSFGPYLKQCRELHISKMIACRRALVFGDGDGRFLAELVRHSPKMQVTAVDASREMLVVSHFFLDCFDEGELVSLLTSVNAAVDDSAIWVVSDFSIPQRIVARQVGMLMVRGLYLAFGLLTGLKTRRLPNHEHVMREAGWILEDRRRLLLGLLVSERWRRSLCFLNRSAS
jgi:hypothetical protein